MIEKNREETGSRKKIKQKAEPAEEGGGRIDEEVKQRSGQPADNAEQDSDGQPFCKEPEVAERVMKGRRQSRNREIAILSGIFFTEISEKTFHLSDHPVNSFLSCFTQKPDDIIDLPLFSFKKRAVFSFPTLCGFRFWPEKYPAGKSGISGIPGMSGIV